MNCPSRDELAELAFLAAKGEESKPPFGEHLSECPSCAPVYSEYCRIVDALISAARSADDEDKTSPCLNDNLLAEYVDHALNAEDQRSVELHLASCLACIRDLLALHELVESTDSQTSVLTFVVGLAKKGLEVLSHPPEGFTPLQASPVPVLDGKSAGTLHKSTAWTQRAGDYAFQFRVNQEEGARASVLVGLESGDGVSADGLRLTLRYDGSIVQSEALAADKATTLAGLHLKDYTLSVTLPGGESLPFNLSLRDLD